MRSKNRYVWAGLGFLVAGGVVSTSAYFILGVTWLTALGVSMLILSFLLLALAGTVPKLPPEVSALLLETGVDNVTAIIEELGIRARAIYLPSSLTSGGVQALIPLHANPSVSSVTEVFPRRLIVRHGADPDDVGLLVTTAGTVAVRMLESKPGPVSAEIESVLSTLFRGILDVADRVTVASHENGITIEIYNPRIESRATRYHECIGGTLASIVASVAAEALDKPVTITREEKLEGKQTVELKVLG